METRESAQELFREKAYGLLEKHGPGVVCIYMNTGDRREWENHYGETLDPKVEGVPLVDDHWHYRNRINVVYQSDFENWKQGKPIEARDHMAKKGPGRRRRGNPQPESVEDQAESG